MQQSEAAISKLNNVGHILTEGKNDICELLNIQKQQSIKDLAEWRCLLRSTQQQQEATEEHSAQYLRELPP
jgi:hypothetical protein